MFTCSQLVPCLSGYLYMRLYYVFYMYQREYSPGDDERGFLISTKLRQDVNNLKVRESSFLIFFSLLDVIFESLPFPKPGSCIVLWR